MFFGLGSLAPARDGRVSKRDTAVLRLRRGVVFGFLVVASSFLLSPFFPLPTFYLSRLLRRSGKGRAFQAPLKGASREGWPSNADFTRGISGRPAAARLSALLCCLVKLRRRADDVWEVILKSPATLPGLPGGSEGLNGVSEYLLENDAATGAAALIYNCGPRRLGGSGEDILVFRDAAGTLWKGGCLAKRSREQECGKNCLVKPVAALSGRFCCVAPEARFDDTRRKTWEDLATVRFVTA